MSSGGISQPVILGRNTEKPEPSRVFNYDFRRPDRFSKDQIRNLSLIHENFARLTTTGLCAALRMKTEIHVTLVDQLTFGEFLKSLSLPAVLNIIQINPLNRPAILAWDCSLGAAFTERLTGGTGNLVPVHREPSPGERKLMKLLLLRMLKNLGMAWHDIADIQPTFSHIEHNAEFAQIVAPSEMIVLISFDVILPDGVRQMDLCFPYLTIEPFLQQLSGTSRIKHLRSGYDHGEQIIPRISVARELFYGTEKLSLARLGTLKKGSLIELPDYGRGSVSMAIGGIPVVEMKRETGRKEQSQRFSISEEQKNLLYTDYLLTFPNDIDKQQKRNDKALTTAVEGVLSKLESAITRLGNQMERVHSRQDEIIDSIAQDGSNFVNLKADRTGIRPFSFITSNDIEILSLYLDNEHPQFNALVLSYLERADSAAILSGMPAERQVEVAARIVKMDWVSKDVLTVLEEFLQEKMDSAIDESISSAGGVEVLAEVLNISPRRIEKSVVESLEKIDVSLAEDVKNRMFVFEDIVLLDQKSLSRLSEAISENDLVFALKTVDIEVREYILSSMESESAKKIEDGVKALGRMKLSDIEAAQQRIIMTIRELEADGVITIARSDEVIE